MSTPLAPSVQTTAGFLPPAAAADAAARPADPNSAHRLLPDCVLHNVLALLVVRDVFELGACSRSFQNGALRTPHLNACVGRPAPDGVFTLHRVLARFQNSVSTLYVGDMEGIPMRHPGRADDGGGGRLLVRNVRDVAHKRMTAVFNNLDNLRDLSMHNVRLDPAAFDGFVSAMDRFYTDADVDALGVEDGAPGRISQLARLDLRGALFPDPGALRARLCDQLNPRNLAELTLEGCRTLDDACLGAVVTRCKGLVRLCVAGGTRLRRPSLSHAKLRCVDMSRCTNLRGFAGLHLPRLEELCLQWCRRFEDAAAASLFASGTSPRLRAVDLDGCVALRTLIVSPPVYSSGGALMTHTGGAHGATSLPCLRYLRVGMCEDLTTVKVRGCPGLEDLALALCVGLSHLQVESSGLRALSLALLPQMVLIELRCPNLVNLDLTGTGVKVRDADSAYKSGGMGDLGSMGSGGGMGPRLHDNEQIPGGTPPLRRMKPPYYLDLTGCNAAIIVAKDEVRRLREGDGPTATGLGYGMHADIEDETSQDEAGERAGNKMPTTDEAAEDEEDNIMADEIE
jgi:hypothetical protein